MKNTTYTLSNIIAGVLFLIHAFWQLLDKMFFRTIDLDYLLKYEFESIIILGISLVVAIFCFLARKNGTLLLVTGFSAIGMFMANFFTYASIGAGLYFSSPSIILLSVAALTLKYHIPHNRFIKNLLWILPFIFVIPMLSIHFAMMTTDGLWWNGCWDFIHWLLYGLGCSMLAFWCIYSPDAPIQKVAVSQTSNVAMTKYCSTCGKEIHINAVVCPNCGCAVPKK